MKQDDMRKLICPIMSTGATDEPFVYCQGDQCVAFGSRPTYEYLGMEGEAQPFSNKLKYFDRDDDSTELKSLLAQGWIRSNPSPTVSRSSLRRDAKPDCWCDAMPANMECVGGGQ